MFSEYCHPSQVTSRSRRYAKDNPSLTFDGIFAHSKKVSELLFLDFFILPVGKLSGIRIEVDADQHDAL